MSMMIAPRIAGSRLTPPHTHNLQAKASNTHRGGRMLTEEEKYLAKMIHELQEAIKESKRELTKLNSNNNKNLLLKIREQEKLLESLIEEWRRSA